MSAPISPERKNGKSPQLGIRGNDVGSEEEEENLPFNDNNSDTKSALTLVPDYIDSQLRQSIRNRNKQVLYLSQIAYGSGLLLKVSIKVPKATQLNSSTNFVSLCTAKYHKQIARVLCMLNFNIDHKEIDEPVSLKKAMA